METLAKDDGADVVGHAGARQYVQVHWRPLVVLNGLDVVRDLLLDLLGQHVLAQAELAEYLQGQLTMLFPPGPRREDETCVQTNKLGEDLHQ